MRNIFPLIAIVLLFSCSDAENQTKSASVAEKRDSTTAKTDGTATADLDTTKKANAAAILAKKQVPVLCYHHIQESGKPLRSTDGYDIYEEKFKDQLKALADSGYKTILPDQYYNYLVYGASIPEKSVMLTYDDTDLEQFTIAKREMDKYGFKGVYFIMTIAIGKPRYMSKDQMKQLADEGHAVELHTWDHHRADRYAGEDWDKQITKPMKTIEDITGKPVTHFAYPFGVWNAAGIPELKKRGIKMAYQLSMKRDSTDPLYTVRRIIVPGWSGQTLLSNIRSSFK